MLLEVVQNDLFGRLLFTGSEQLGNGFPRIVDDGAGFFHRLPGDACLAVHEREGQGKFEAHDGHTLLERAKPVSACCGSQGAHEVQEDFSCFRHARNRFRGG